MTRNGKRAALCLSWWSSGIFSIAILLFGPLHLHFNGLHLLELQQRYIFSLLIMCLPWSQDNFHTWWSSSVDGAAISQSAANGAGHEAGFFSTLCGQTSPACFHLTKASLPGEVCFPPLFYRDHLACTFCLPVKICVRPNPCFRF